MPSSPNHPTSTLNDPTQSTVTAALLRLQHHKGWISNADLAELAAELEVPLYMLEEVVSFFPHFRRSPPPLIELQVCRDLSCHLAGSNELVRKLQYKYQNDPSVAIRPVSCLGRCDKPPAACLSRFTSAHGGKPEDDIIDYYYRSRDGRFLVNAVTRLKSGEPPPPPDLDANDPPTMPLWNIDVYRGKPTYDAAARLLKQIRLADNPEEARAKLDLIPKLELANLRGMGGAGAPAAKKWNDVRQAPGSVKYIVCNADESEPGTFKDRELLLRTPWLIIEGMILAGIVTGASRGYIYLRHEYPEQAAALRAAIADAERQGVCGTNIGRTGIDFPISLFISPGGYICGEQSALIEAMEGKRAQPRNRPPELATNGLFDKPTLVNNVETFAWVPGIALNTVLSKDHPESQVNWYGNFAKNYPKKIKQPDGSDKIEYGGIRFFSISGDVVRPGVYEIPIGAPLRVLIEAAGGVIGGIEQLKAIATSGPSGGFLPRILRDSKNPEISQDLLEVPLDIDEFRRFGAMLGAGLVVYSAQRNLLDQAVNATEFFRNESCGKCVPCRIGSQKLVDIGLRIRRGEMGKTEFIEQKLAVRELDRTLELTSICGLGQVAAKPLASVLQFFEADVKGYMFDATLIHPVTG
jgi:NADH:ubiquinone oxidoreductase subunit F (NADH-binding)/NADH:ubiquinone oxidoreductase subunit E